MKAQVTFESQFAAEFLGLSPSALTAATLPALVIRFYIGVFAKQKLCYSIIFVRSIDRSVTFFAVVVVVFKPVFFFLSFTNGTWDIYDKQPKSVDCSRLRAR